MDVDNSSIDLDSLDIELPEVNQISITVEDLEDGMKRFHKLLGVDAWRVYHLEGDAHTETIFKGEPHEFSMDVALSADSTDGGIRLWREDRTEIELIAPTEGTSSYTEQLDEHGEGLHHVACWDFEDPEAVLQQFVDAGFEVYQRGRVFGRSEYAYIDTRDVLNGVLLEIGLSGVRSKQPTPADHPKIEDVDLSEE